MKTNPGLKRSCYLWLKDKHAWTQRQIIQFDDLERQNLKTHRAVRIKETLREINELKPLFGLELTATPLTESSSGPVPFKNVVMDYPLARAIEDGFV